MSKRALIAMSADEVSAFLAASRKLQLATINPDGTPHLVTMFYGLLDEKIAFWTYGKAQKARNIERDPRVSCLIESGDKYADLRGVLLYGRARRIGDPELILEVGMRVARTMPGLTGLSDDDFRGYVAHAARKRVAFAVEPDRVVSWDHEKLG